jgi:hypothetical protein
MLLRECATGAVTRWQPCAACGHAQRWRLRDRHRQWPVIRRALPSLVTGGLSIPEDRRYRLRLPPGAAVFGHAIVGARPALAP